jgi:hypothetical protein
MRQGCGQGRVRVTDSHSRATHVDAKRSLDSRAFQANLYNHHKTVAGSYQWGSLAHPHLAVWVKRLDEGWTVAGLQKEAAGGSPSEMTAA